MAVAIVLAAGLLGYLFSSPPPPAPDANVITLSARQTRTATPTVRTDDPERAERFVLSHLGQRLILPSISRAALQGVGIEEVAPGAHVPAFAFADSLTGRTVTLYAYTYALLQRHADRLELEGDILRQIEDAAPRRHPRPRRGQGARLAPPRRHLRRRHPRRRRGPPPTHPL